MSGLNVGGVLRIPSVNLIDQQLFNCFSILGIGISVIIVWVYAYPSLFTFRHKYSRVYIRCISLCRFCNNILLHINAVEISIFNGPLIKRFATDT